MSVGFEMTYYATFASQIIKDLTKRDFEVSLSDFNFKLCLGFAYLLLLLQFLAHRDIVSNPKPNNNLSIPSGVLYLLCWFPHYYLELQLMSVLCFMMQSQSIFLWASTCMFVLTFKMRSKKKVYWQAAERDLRERVVKMEAEVAKR
jgi:hypothetical protein